MSPTLSHIHRGGHNLAAFDLAALGARRLTGKVRVVRQRLVEPGTLPIRTPGRCPRRRRPRTRHRAATAPLRRSPRPRFPDHWPSTNRCRRRHIPRAARPPRRVRRKMPDLSSSQKGERQRRVAARGATGSRRRQPSAPPGLATRSHGGDVARSARNVELRGQRPAFAPGCSRSTGGSRRCRAGRSPLPGSWARAGRPGSPPWCGAR
jgi:hypothetical protein